MLWFCTLAYALVRRLEASASRRPFSDFGMLAHENILSNFEFTCCGK